ncbi:MAG TPA: hypothetical protein VND93_12515 [Myxococcales bacterium]|nr:hypothetical protein [Myxococcales bacterium]
MGTSQAALVINLLPPEPVMQPVLGYEHGRRTGLETASRCGDARVVFLPDPSNSTRFYAIGFDLTNQVNVFQFTVLRTDFNYFMSQLTIDASAWRAMRGTLGTEWGITDGLGGPVPPPTPGLLQARAWKHAFYAHDMQAQIDVEGP